MANDTVFHDGEVTMHKLQDVTEKMQSLGSRVIRTFMPDQHRDFFQNLTYLFLGVMDKQGRPWATIATGDAGFITSASETSLSIKSVPVGVKMLDLQLSKDCEIGLLGLDFSNRRRNRVNGSISKEWHDSIELSVRQSFGNCPKYIQIRSLKMDADTHSGEVSQRQFSQLGQHEKSVITSNDGFFIASAYIKDTNSDSDDNDRSVGVDISHRGGEPGFVRVENDSLLWFYDYPGNNFFNTLGNILKNPVIGLLFIDYEAGDVYMLNGRAKIHHSDESDSAPDKHARKISFELEQGYCFSNAITLRWSLLDYSPALQNIETIK